jgi:calcineurin-like phosphoesterase family protein
MKTTRYFDEQVLRKRPYLSLDMCLAVLQSPLNKVVQPDGRIRFFGEVSDAVSGQTRVLRVVTLADGETVHNAFFDRGYREQEK